MYLRKLEKSFSLKSVTADDLLKLNITVDRDESEQIGQITWTKQDDSIPSRTAGGN